MTRFTRKRHGTRSTGTTRSTRAARRLVAGAAIAAMPAGVLALPTTAFADSSQATDHFVAQQTDYFPKAGDDPTTFYGIFSLDGACGYDSATYSQSDTETFFVAQHNNGQTGYKYNSVGKIDDETWTFSPLDADGNTITTFSGTADEVATAVGTDNGAAPRSVNYSFIGNATSPDGQTLHLVVKGILRSDDQGNVTRFDWGIQSCVVH
jgi:hypothetical protein